MRKFTTLMTLIAVGLIAISCSTPCPPVEEPETIDINAAKAEIMAMEEAYAVAENAKDVEGILVYYADDAVSMPHNQPIIEGKEAIRKRLTDRFAKSDDNGTVSFKTESIMAEGNLLVESGSSTYTSESGEVKTGKFVSIFEKRDGKYVCIRDIWNNDQDDDNDMDDDDEMEEEMD